MSVNFLKVVAKPVPVRSWIFFALMIWYAALSLCIFVLWVGPSLDGRTDQHIAADSTTYIYLADAIREGRVDPIMFRALAAFPNTLWSPVLEALVLKTTWAMVLANYVMFALALYLLKKSFSFSTGVFSALLLLNATTTISLLSVNKEAMDILAISLFLFAHRRGYRFLVALALVFGFFNRFEVSLVMLMFLLVKSRLNPFRNRRGVTLVAVILALSILLPLALSNSLALRAGEAEGAGVIALLDSLESHYLYGLAVIPKIGQNLFGELVNVSGWTSSYSISNIANSYVLLSNNLATAVVCIILIRKRLFSLRFDLVYFSTLGWILMAVALVIQPRYFYFTYFLLCLHAAQPSASQATALFSSDRSPEIANA